MKPVVIVIGGTDSSGGAGLSRDITTLTELGCEARPVVTAVTAQTDLAVHAVAAISPDHVAQQLSSALATGPVDAIKTGMLHSSETVLAVAEVLADFATIPLVIDPVLVSSSGTRLLDPDGITALKTHLLPLCTLVTPNLPEGQMLTGSERPELQAKALLELGAGAVLIKGGHSDGEASIDQLFQTGQSTREFAAPRLNATLRGTGCMLASAIAANLSLGHTRHQACSLAKDFVAHKLRQAACQV
jgi:hydroxymethylpyrimidine/phosphomethylpyrimidine kinase